MTAPVPDARIYADFAGLESLKRGAGSNDPAALRQVAKQFESLFARMMIKSMRDASGTDPIFGSDQQKMYEGMFDDQLSVEMTRGRGLGLADMLVRQLQRMAGAPAGGTDPTGSAAGAPSTPSASAQPAPASSAAQASFVRELWPQAQQAGAQLGVDPRSLIAQAALETSWGTSMPRDASGRSSNNLFGIKAGSAWSGPSVDATTQEYQNGAAVSTAAPFRAYGSSAESFQDYVALLRGSPRYAAALNTGGDAHAFANALQSAGYATDPEYARKVSAIAASLGGAAGATPSETVTALKSGSARPIDLTSTL
jgi:flagellar protein FlgJ